MNLFTRKIHLFCVSNLMLSFVCTGFLGIRTTTGIIDGSTTGDDHEISLTSSDTEPVSHYGEGENSFAFITESVEAVITQQEETIFPDLEGEENEFAFITESIEAVISKQENALETKKVAKKTTTKKSSSKKATTSVVTKKEVNKSSSYTKPSYSSVTGDAIVSFAKQFIGLRYRSGVPSLTKGADCSGFTMLIYREFGVSLPRNVSGQASRGKYVAKKDLQKGDLVFYKAKGAKGGPTHVGIYIGGGQVIHESRPGVGVKINTVNMMQYVTARRVINSKATQIAQAKLDEQNKANNAETTNSTSITTNNAETTNNTSTTTNNENNVNNNTVVETPSVSATPEVTTTPSSTPAPTPTPEVPKETPVATPKVEVESTSTEESN